MEIIEFHQFHDMDQSEIRLAGTENNRNGPTDFSDSLSDRWRWIGKVPALFGTDQYPIDISDDCTNHSRIIRRYMEVVLRDPYCRFILVRLLFHKLEVLEETYGWEEASH